MSRTEPIRPVVLVTRAMCASGGSVLRRIRERGRFAVRAMTRTPDSLTARALAEQGMEVVAGDLDDVDALRSAMAGCYGVFGYVGADACGRLWQRTLNLLDAGADAGVGYVVIGVHSCTVSSASTTAAELPRLEAYARSLGVPATFLHCDTTQNEDLGCAIADAFERRVDAMLRS